MLVSGFVCMKLGVFCGGIMWIMLNDCLMVFLLLFGSVCENVVWCVGLLIVMRLWLNDSVML